MDQLRREELIIDDRVNGIFRVNRRAFTDPAIFEIEKREVFDRCWLYAGHVSEIAKPGDFVTRRVGGRPLILVCDRVGEPHALLNSCPHRGNIVCRERAGFGAQNFVCFYHAWNFDLDGSLVGVPDEESYTPAFDRGAMGLRPVPRFENYKGMLFVNFDPASRQSGQLSRQRPRISRLHARFRRRRCRDRTGGAGLQHEGQLETAD